MGGVQPIALNSPCAPLSAEFQEVAPPRADGGVSPSPRSEPAADGHRAGLAHFKLTRRTFKSSGTAGKQRFSLPPVLLLPPHPPDPFPSQHKAPLFGARHLHARRQLALQQLAGDGLLLIKLQETAPQLEWSSPSFQGLGRPKYLLLYLQTAFIGLKRGSRQRRERGPLCTACRDMDPCTWPAGTVGTPQQLGLYQGLAVTPRDVTAWAFSHLERRCHLGVKGFKPLEQVWGASGSQIFHSLLFSLTKIYFYQAHPLSLLLCLL